MILEDRNYLIWITHWALPGRICNPPAEDNIEKFQGGITEFDKKKYIDSPGVKCKRNIYRNFSGHSQIDWKSKVQLQKNNRYPEWKLTFILPVSDYDLNLNNLIDSRNVRSNIVTTLEF